MEPVIPIIILALPLTMFLVLGLFGHKMSHPLAGVLGTAGMGVTMVLAYITVFHNISFRAILNLSMLTPIRACNR